MSKIPKKRERVYLIIWAFTNSGDIEVFKRWIIPPYEIQIWTNSMKSFCKIGNLKLKKKKGEKLKNLQIERKSQKNKNKTHSH